MAGVFLSSVVQGLEPFRDAAADAARTLGHVVTRSEDFAASETSPREKCLRAARASDVTLVVLGPRYGAPQPSGKSPTHEEFEEAAGNNVPVLAFVQSGVEREAAQERFVSEVRDWASGVYTASFTTVDQLAREVTRALHEWELANAAGPIDEDEMVSHAKGLVPNTRTGVASSEELGLVVVGAPRRQILRPAELEDSDLATDIQQAGMFGAAPVLDRTAATQMSIEADWLRIEQRDASVSLSEDGSLHIIQPAREATHESGLPVLIEEAVRSRLGQGLTFSDWVLERVDPVRRLSDVVALAYISGAGYVAWKTQAEHDRDPNTATMGFGRSDVVVVKLTPARRARAALRRDAAALAEDLTVLLRRAWRT